MKEKKVISVYGKNFVQSIISRITRNALFIIFYSRHHRVSDVISYRGALIRKSFY